MIQIEHTPNPDTLKFLPGKKVSDAGPVEFLKNEENIKVPLVNKIFALQGTTMVFFGEDFITVKKERHLKWDDLKHHIISEINDYYLKGNNVVIGKNFSTFKSKLSESIVEKICPIGKEINKLLQDKDYLYTILVKGTKKADLIAKVNLKEIYNIIGLNKFS